MPTRQVHFPLWKVCQVHLPSVCLLSVRFLKAVVDLNISITVTFVQVVHRLSAENVTE